jgi:hypothetical protein
VKEGLQHRNVTVTTTIGGGKRELRNPDDVEQALRIVVASAYTTSHNTESAVAILLYENQ